MAKFLAKPADHYKKEVGSEKALDHYTSNLRRRQRLWARLYFCNHHVHRKTRLHLSSLVAWGQTAH